MEDFAGIDDNGLFHETDLVFINNTSYCATLQEMYVQGWVHVTLDAFGAGE